ncbi:hypothetical protein GGR57DRAFT_420787 [Xylariaceae sp. FL1272]|nr:hypothetical protein GGR57DRAFT_420787 [Xylariaceae sp. FL1272]
MEFNVYWTSLTDYGLVPQNDPPRYANMGDAAWRLSPLHATWTQIENMCMLAASLSDPKNVRPPPVSISVLDDWPRLQYTSQRTAKRCGKKRLIVTASYPGRVVSACCWLASRAFWPHGNQLQGVHTLMVRRTREMRSRRLNPARHHATLGEDAGGEAGWQTFKAFASGGCERLDWFQGPSSARAMYDKIGADPQFEHSGTTS